VEKFEIAKNPSMLIGIYVMTTIMKCHSHYAYTSNGLEKNMGTISKDIYFEIHATVTEKP